MTEISSSTPSKPTFIPEFEGLRGILAAWVVFGHILLFSGFTYQDGWFGMIFSPVLGVYAFMMLSGFVIFAALDQRPTTWLSFMSRRFWRLFPVYALCLGLAIVMFNMSMNVSNSNALATFGSENLERLNDVEQNFGLYLIADSTLLQCLMPRAWFPFAHESFLPPTWSLTIEWLFYMVAPLLRLIVKRGRWLGLGVIGSLIVAVNFLEPWLTTTMNRSFHLGNAFHFLTGIGCYYVWKHLPERKNCWITMLLFWSVIVGGILLLSLPYKIWLATMAVVLYDRVHLHQLSFLEWPRKILNSQPLQFLGRTSYVTYLLHWIVVEIVLFWWVEFVPDVSNPFALATVCTFTVFPLTYLFAHVIHLRIENPAKQIPRRWKQFQTKRSNEVVVPCPDSIST